jgi:hypothetical protein
MMGGTATRKRIRITWSGPGGAGGMNLILFIPAACAPRPPCILFICNREPETMDPERKLRSAFWPAEAIVGRGYAAAVFNVGDVAPDYFDDYSTGVHATFARRGQPRADTDWGTIAAWAWGASRAVDYLVTDPDLDARRIAVAGHSRGGKSALWCGAQDERAALTISNDSGCCGAALFRGKGGEDIERINRVFPHWFCGNFKHWNHREAELPVDQHELLALCAPRLVYVASATLDETADPAAEFRACVAASPIWVFLGRQGLPGKEPPPPGYLVHGGAIGYHLRAGEHDLTEYDWNCFMDYADRHLR